MKKLLIIAALFLGFSAAGFSQTADGSIGTIDLVVTDKIIVDNTQYVYKLKDVNTGLDYVSLPTGVQLAIGEHVTETLLPALSKEFNIAIPDEQAE